MEHEILLIYLWIIRLRNLVAKAKVKYTHIHTFTLNDYENIYEMMCIAYGL